MMKQYKVLRFKRVKNEAKEWMSYSIRVRIEFRSGFNIQPSEERSYKWWSRSNDSRLKLKWSTFTNEYRMNLEGAFKLIQPSQEWSYKWFFRSNESRLKLKWSTFTNEYRMNLEGALKLKRVKNKGIRGF